MSVLFGVIGSVFASFPGGWASGLGPKCRVLLGTNTVGRGRGPGNREGPGCPGERQSTITTGPWLLSSLSRSTSQPPSVQQRLTDV